MPSVPVIPGSYTVNTPTAGVQANFNALDQPNRVDAATGQTVGAIGRELGDFAIKLQEGVNYGIAAETDAKMRQTAADFQQSLIGRTDEGQWESQWAEKSNQVWQNIQDTNKIGPSLRRRLTANFKEWQASNAIEVKTVANKQKINRAIERVGLAADGAARDGQEEAINSIFDGAVENHLMTPEKAEMAKAEYGAKSDVYAGNNYIISNPIEALDYISEKDKNGQYANLKRLNPSQRESLISTARGAARAQRTQFQEDIAARRFAGEFIPESDLQLAVDQRLISPSWAKSFKKQQDRDMAKDEASENAASDFSSVRSAITAFDPQSAGGQQYEELYRRAMLLPGSMATDAIAMLKEKADPKNALNGPVSKQIFQDIEQRFKSGFYGKYQNTILNTKTGETTTVTDYKKQEEAMAKTARVQDFFRQYIQQNPTATQEQANRAVAEFQIKETTKAASRPILNSMGIMPVPGAQEDATALKTRLDAILSKSKK